MGKKILVFLMLVFFAASGFAQSALYSADVVPLAVGSPAKIVSIPANSTISIDAPLNYRYSFKNWGVSGNCTISNPGSPKTAINVNGNCTASPTYAFVCGNGTIEVGENCTTCPADMPCTVGKCQSGACVKGSTKYYSLHFHLSDYSAGSLISGYNENSEIKNLIAAGTVKNLSTSGGSNFTGWTVDGGCPISSKTSAYTAITITGNCVLTANYSPAIIQSKCGNGTIDLGENCSTCQSDVKCSSGTACSNGTCISQDCTSGNCCVNGKLIGTASNPVQPTGKTDYLYLISDSAASTQTCKKIDYYCDGGFQTEKITYLDLISNSDSCREIIDCNTGKTPAISNKADGTNCGTNKICESGICVDSTMAQCTSGDCCNTTTKQFLPEQTISTKYSITGKNSCGNTATCVQTVKKCTGNSATSIVETKNQATTSPCNAIKSGTCAGNIPAQIDLVSCDGKTCSGGICSSGNCVNAFSLAVLASPAIGGTTAGSASNISIGAIKAISSNPATNYFFRNWGSSGNCTISNPNNQSTTAQINGNCIATANFNMKNTCGNGTIDLGENCSTCQSDVKCPIGQTCSNGTCAPGTTNCGNKIIDSGEDCTNCPEDAICSIGTSCSAGKCIAPEYTCSTANDCPEYSAALPVCIGNSVYTKNFEVECLNSKCAITPVETVLNCEESCVLGQCVPRRPYFPEIFKVTIVSG